LASSSERFAADADAPRVNLLVELQAHVASMRHPSQKSQQPEAQSPPYDHHICPPPYAMDAAYFAHHFRALLTDLTFNSKLIIDELTRMSQDVQHSRFVAQCLDEHIMAVSAQRGEAKATLLTMFTSSVRRNYVYQRCIRSIRSARILAIRTTSASLIPVCGHQELLTFSSNPTA
jgi:hypothetical protein